MEQRCNRGGAPPRSGCLLEDIWPLPQILRDGRKVEITSALARRILNECRSEYQIDPGKRRVEFLAGKIKNGDLWDRRLSFALLDGRLILVNGADRLTAVSRSGVAVRFLVRVVPVGSREEVRALVFSPGISRPEPKAETPIGPAMPQPHASGPATQPQPASAAPAVNGRSTSDVPLTQMLVHGREMRITPELADRIEKECRYKYERPVKQWRVDFLAAEIERGGFEQGRQISFALFNGKLIRVNGQHRLRAVATTGSAQTFMVEVKQVANDHELAALYATYDSESRTLLETAGPLMKKGDLGKEQVATLLRSVQFIYTGFRKPDERQAATMRSHVMRNSVAEIWYSYAERYFALTEQAPGKDGKAALRRQSVAAVALYTLRYQPEKAAEFWQGLAMDDGLRRTDPRKSLLEKLRSGDGARSITFQMHAVAAAWNAFFAGRKLKEVRVSLEKPFRIAGTPVLVDRLDEELGNA
jgi:hypothetical protein